MANWEELPQDLLEFVSGRLAIEDYLAFGGVCTSWRSAARKEAYKVKSKAPWLMIYGGNKTPQFISPTRGRINGEMVPAPGSRCQTMATPGWLLVPGYVGQAMSTPGWIHAYSKYRLFNPLSGISIELPALTKHGLNMCGCCPLRIDRIAMSSSPSLSKSYTVMISVHWDLGSQRVAFHRSGDDGWTIVSPSTYVLQLIYYNGLFVALAMDNLIMTLNERERHMELRLILGKYFEGRPHLVECSGSLLVAWKIPGKEYRPVKCIRVFKVDLENGTHEEVKSLGNASLFLNDHSSSSFSVEFDGESCLPKIKPNHIYFTEYEKQKSYSLDDGKVRLYFDGDRCHSYAATWFQPEI